MELLCMGFGVRGTKCLSHPFGCRFRDTSPSFSLQSFGRISCHFVRYTPHNIANAHFGATIL